MGFERSNASSTDERSKDPSTQPRLAALRRLVKGLDVYDLRPPGKADQETALEAVANAIAYEVVGRADVPELRRLILGHHLARSSGHPPASDASPGSVSQRQPGRNGEPHKEDGAPDGKGHRQPRRP